MKENLKKFIRKILTKNTYEGKFNNYKEAKIQTSQSIKDYIDDNSKKKIYTHLDVEIKNRHYVTSVLVSVLASLNKINKKLNILDIGGGEFPIISFIKNSNNLKVNCFVLETNSFIKNITIPKIYKKNLKYISSLSFLPKKKIPIVVFNSSIQYFEKYEEILNEIFRYQPSYIVVTKTTFQDGCEDYFTLQKNIKPNIFLNRFFSFTKFKKFFLLKKFQLIFKAKHLVNYKHNYINNKNFYELDLIFKKMI
jgi:putative methyltransferase (TIGR04325 family)